MGTGPAHGVEFAPVRLHHYRPGVAGGGRDKAKRLVRLSLLEIDLVHPYPRPQGLYYGIAPLYDAVFLKFPVHAAPSCL